MGLVRPVHYYLKTQVILSLFNRRTALFRNEVKWNYQELRKPPIYPHHPSEIIWTAGFLYKFGRIDKIRRHLHPMHWNSGAPFIWL